VSARCLVRFTDGGVAQSVIPQNDLRMREAMRAHAVKSTVLPPEPRCAGRTARGCTGRVWCCGMAARLH
jgi:hypothetical protein